MRRPLLQWVFAFVAAIGLAAAVAARLTPPEPECAAPVEASRPLDLARAEDRAHMSEDVNAISAAAQAFGEAVSRRPLASDSFDAQAGARTAPARARAWCEAVLADAVAKRHHVTVEHVRAQLGASSALGPVGHADGDRIGAMQPSVGSAAEPVAPSQTEDR
jgi:hypothetical protein